MRANPAKSSQFPVPAASAEPRSLARWGFLLLLALAPSLVAEPALAQTTPTYVSGTGSDSNACTQRAPCLTLQAALAKTTAGGEIYALDSADYGYLSINKAISILGGPGVAGVLGSASVSGISISAGANDVINLQGIDLDGAGSSANGILFSAGAALNIKDSVIRGFTNGIAFQPAGSSGLTMTGTLISSNGTGVLFQSSAASTGGLSNVQ